MSTVLFERIAVSCEPRFGSSLTPACECWSVSIGRVGLPKPTAVWLGYLIPELVLPFVIAIAHYAGR